MGKLKSRRIALNLVSILVFTVVTCLIGGSSYIINLADTNKDRLVTSIELQNRQHARGFLLYLNDKLAQDVDNETIDISDEQQVEQWAKDNIRTVKNDSTYHNIAVIKVEYSEENDEFIGKYLWSATSQQISNGLGYKTTFDLLVEQELAKEYFSDNPELSGQDLISYKDIRDNGLYGKKTVEELVDLGIIRFQNHETVQEVLDAFYEGTISNNNDNYSFVPINGGKSLVEWTTVPLEASEGINGEPKTNKGTLNPKYSRLVIASTINSDYIEKPFENQFGQLDELKFYIHVAIITFVVLSLLMMLYFTWLIYYTNRPEN
jgi:hypothetical protein